jgi:hypothetical protein
MNTAPRPLVCACASPRVRWCAVHRCWAPALPFDARSRARVVAVAGDLALADALRARRA